MSTIKSLNICSGFLFDTYRLGNSVIAMDGVYADSAGVFIGSYTSGATE